MNKENIIDNQIYLGGELYRFIVLDILMELYPELSHEALVTKVEEGYCSSDEDEYIEIAMDYDMYGFVFVRQVIKQGILTDEEMDAPHKNKRIVLCKDCCN